MIIAARSSMRQWRRAIFECGRRPIQLIVKMLGKGYRSFWSILLNQKEAAYVGGLC